MVRPAMFVTFEGLDGSGKSTQVELLRKLLEAEGRTVVTTREPGGTPLGEQVREILLHREGEIVPWAEAALFAAARSQLVEHVIAPALEAGYDVLCDRYIDSSLAYQGVARGMGVDRVLELNLQATRGLLPDRTILLLVDLEEARARTGDGRDRIESDADFIARVDRAYRELGELFPRRILTADGSQDPNQLARLIRGQLRDLS
jgi:dTMP kinase